MTVQDFIRFCREKELAPRIINWKLLYKILAKLCTVYIKSKLEPTVNSEKVSKGTFAEVIAICNNMVIDRALFVEGLIMICLNINFGQENFFAEGDHVGNKIILVQEFCRSSFERCSKKMC